MSDNKVYAFTGHYGSGKTEAAVNFALHLKNDLKHDKVALLDIDIVNPFFRSSDARRLLEDNGIRVEAPMYANTNIDVPALTAVMGAIIRNREFDVVLDVGGDDLGAKAVGCYSDDIKTREYECFFVMNPKRPFTKDIISTQRIFDEIRYTSEIDYTGIINNTNMLDDTSVELILNDSALVYEFARVNGLNVSYNCVYYDIVDNVISSGDERFNAATVIPIRRTVARLF